MKRRTGSEPPSVVMLNDWFSYYLSPIAVALAREAPVWSISRDHGIEFGAPRAAPELRQALLPGVECDFVPGGPLSLSGLRAVARLARRLRRAHVDVVHSQEHSDWRLLALSLVPRGALRVVTVHDVTPHPGAEFRNHPLKRLVRRGLYRSAHVFIVHGRALATELARDRDVRRSSRVEVVPHGVLAHAVAQRPLPTLPTLLFFGRWEYYKGLDLLIAAAERAAPDVPRLRVVVAGDGPDAARCRALITVENLFDWRQGFVPDDGLAGLFAACTAVVLPYREASQSGVVPLAFSNGRTVIASDVGALSEAVCNDTNGLLVEPGDVAALTRAIVDLFNRPRLLDSLTAGARATAATDLSPEEIAKRHRAIYRVGCS